MLGLIPMVNTYLREDSHNKVVPYVCEPPARMASLIRLFNEVVCIQFFIAIAVVYDSAIKRVRLHIKHGSFGLNIILHQLIIRHVCICFFCLIFNRIRNFNKVAVRAQSNCFCDPRFVCVPNIFKGIS